MISDTKEIRIYRFHDKAALNISIMENGVEQGRTIYLTSSQAEKLSCDLEVLASDIVCHTFSSSRYGERFIT